MDDLQTDAAPQERVPIQWGWVEWAFVLITLALISSWVIGCDHTF